MLVGFFLKKLNQTQAIRYAGWAMIVAAAVLAIFPGLNDVIMHFSEATYARHAVHNGAPVLLFATGQGACLIAVPAAGG